MKKKHDFPTTNIFLTVLLFLTACDNSTIKNRDLAPFSQTAIASSTIDNSIFTVTHQTPTPSSGIPPSTPTLRVFSEPSSCAQSANSGHILFLQQNVNFDLYVMDGDACTDHLVMRNVSGSPAWSVDGKRISIGCDNNGFICILDAPASLVPCLESNDPKSKCTPVVIKKYPLPSDEGESHIYNMSWSFDGQQVVVEGEYVKTGMHYVSILTLSGAGKWKTLIESLGRVRTDLSPKKNEIAFDGIFIMSLENNTLLRLENGFAPAWSSDGNKVAFLMNSLDNNKEPTGIAQYDLENQQWRWLYEPLNRDMYYWPPRNLGIGADGEYRSLSWSPDGRYLAFEVVYLHDYNSQIFRLDTLTDDVKVLTPKLEKTEGEHYYFAPAWGP
jgi:WD40 repeat protein